MSERPPPDVVAAARLIRRVCLELGDEVPAYVMRVLEQAGVELEPVQRLSWWRRAWVWEWLVWAIAMLAVVCVVVAWAQVLS